MIQCHSLFVMLQLTRRDMFVFRKRVSSYGINYLIILPLLSIITFGYIQPGIYFGANHSRASIVLLIGMFVINMLSLCFNMLSPFIYDVESERFIDYQILLTRPTTLLFQMILFPSLMASLISLPFFPLARLILPHYFAQLNTHWLGLLAMIVCIAFFCSTYIMLAMCLIKKSLQVRQFWIRCNWPLMVLGGFWIPWQTLKSFSPILANIALLDPFTYITEGLRSALIGSDQFIAYELCAAALILYIIIFAACCVPCFKKKLDHI